MKYRELLIEQLKSLPYFDKKSIYQLSKQYGIKETTVDAYISRSLARKHIIQLKKGMYITTDFYEKNMADISYTFYLANVIKSPSYVSSWSALQYYNLTTESIFITTSITPKVTRTYKTKAGTFIYQSVKNELFSDFFLVKGSSDSSAGKFDFFIASPPKALFDLLYFKTYQFRGVQLKDIKKLIKEMRIDIEEMTKKDRAIFYVMIKKYLNHE